MRGILAWVLVLAPAVLATRVTLEKCYTSYGTVCLKSVPTTTTTEYCTTPSTVHSTKTLTVTPPAKTVTSTVVKGPTSTQTVRVTDTVTRVSTSTSTLPLVPFTTTTSTEHSTTVTVTVTSAAVVIPTPAGFTPVLDTLPGAMNRKQRRGKRASNVQRTEPAAVRCTVHISEVAHTSTLTRTVTAPTRTSTVTITRTARSPVTTTVTVNTTTHSISTVKVHKTNTHTVTHTATPTTTVTVRGTRPTGYAICTMQSNYAGGYDQAGLDGFGPESTADFNVMSVAADSPADCCYLCASNPVCVINGFDNDGDADSNCTLFLLANPGTESCSARSPYGFAVDYNAGLLDDQGFVVNNQACGVFNYASSNGG